MTNARIDLQGKVTVVTGGARGIGRALCRAFSVEGAQLVIADLDQAGAEELAAELGALALGVDVGDEASVRRLIDGVETELGAVDIFVSNAGVAFGDGPNGPASAPAENWERCLAVNLMGHVYAARYVVPGMIDRGGGCLVNVASAAGLLSQIGEAAYSASKHAAVAFAESLAIGHADEGLRVSVVCPQAVATRMIGHDEDSSDTAAGFGGNDIDGVLSPDEVATIVVEGVKDGTFMILPHPAVRSYFVRKADDYDRWIGGMRRFRRRLAAAGD
jgi:NAD(P)-dependent dehydrogenase (short-subunit alcohol dehydrogenase family)